jgi:hypothetical protein
MEINFVFMRMIELITLSHGFCTTHEPTFSASGRRETRPRSAATDTMGMVSVAQLTKRSITVASLWECAFGGTHVFVGTTPAGARQQPWSNTFRL